MFTISLYVASIFHFAGPQKSEVQIHIISTLTIRKIFKKDRLLAQTSNFLLDPK